MDSLTGPRARHGDPPRGSRRGAARPRAERRPCPFGRSSLALASLGNRHRRHARALRHRHGSRVRGDDPRRPRQRAGFERRRSTVAGRPGVAGAVRSGRGGRRSRRDPERRQRTPDSGPGPCHRRHRLAALRGRLGSDSLCRGRGDRRRRSLRRRREPVIPRSVERCAAMEGAPRHAPLGARGTLRGSDRRGRRRRHLDRGLGSRRLTSLERVDRRTHLDSSALLRSPGMDRFDGQPHPRPDITTPRGPPALVVPHRRRHRRRHRASRSARALLVVRHLSLRPGVGQRPPRLEGAPRPTPTETQPPAWRPADRGGAEYGTTGGVSPARRDAVRCPGPHGGQRQVRHVAVGGWRNDRDWRGQIRRGDIARDRGRSRLHSCAAGPAR